jgi:ABC-2 type transport system permease protein
MNKIGLIIGREIKSKLTNKTFIVMTFLTPLIFIGALGLIIWTAMPEKIEQNVLVVDEGKMFANTLNGNDFVTFTFADMDIQKAQEIFPNSDYTAILQTYTGADGTIMNKARVLYKKNPGLAFRTYLQNEMERIYYEQKLKANNIDPTVIAHARQPMNIEMKPVDENGAVDNGDVIQIFSFAMGLIMMLFILLYGMMVFRSVMEEKTNRIVEVIVSSVRPFELMIGKIIGVAIVGIIQFVTTVLITTLLTTILSGIFMKDMMAMKERFDAQNALVKKQGIQANLENVETYKDSQKIFEAMDQLKGINYTQIGIYFVLFFIGGYLFYSSLLAAIGSAVDSESDSQQFMLPIMLPLMIGYFLAIKIMISPESNAVTIGSFVPFTSPIVMMARLPQGVPPWQVFTSLAILYVSFIGTTWFAGKVYRTGILMYGKKTSWREIFKWLRY